MARRACTALVLALLLGACGSSSSVEPPAGEIGSSSTIATTIPASTATVTTAPATAPTSPATSVPASVPTTTTTLAGDPWIVPGRVYYFPVQPPEAATYGREHHDYPATDIFAPAGTTVVAVTAGVIDELSHTDEWDPGTDDPASRSGRYVTIVGDDGVRYHLSHLDMVAAGLEAGAPVLAGQRIGTVGNSGNAAETPSHTHFGISHPTFPGDWEVRRGEVWPWHYLDAWQGGEDLTPVVGG